MIHVSHGGFVPDSVQVTVAAMATEVRVTLRPTAQQLPELLVATTRDERRVADEPTRVEVTDRDDVEEQIGGSPGVIAELLTESGRVRGGHATPNFT